LCKELAKLPKKDSKEKRIVIITCGPNPSHVVEYDFGKQEITFEGSYECDKIENEKIVDTNGAGDAFAGGFLSHFLSKKNLAECVKAAHWAAAQIIQERGCIIPYHKTYQ
jgi:adenosine kinase